MKFYKVINEIRIYCSGCRKVVIPQVVIYNSNTNEGDTAAQTRDISFECNKCRSLLKVVKL